MYINPSFGKVGSRLRKIRKSYKWVLQDACDKVNQISEQLSTENSRYKAVKLNPSHLSKIENDDVDTSDYYIALLCEAYQVKMADLYREDSDFENELNKSLAHLPPHLREFVNTPENSYLINMIYSLKKFDEKQMDTIREFIRIINV